MADQGEKEKKGAIPPAENLAIRKAIMLPNLALSYKAKPIKIVKVSRRKQHCSDFARL